MPRDLRRAILPDAHTAAQRRLEGALLLCLRNMQAEVEYAITGTLDRDDRPIWPVIVSVTPRPDSLAIRLHPDAAVPFVANLIPCRDRETGDVHGIRGLYVDCRRRHVLLKLWTGQGNATEAAVFLRGVPANCWSRALEYFRDNTNGLSVLDPTDAGHGESLSGEPRRWRFNPHSPSPATAQLGSAVLRRFAPLATTTFDIWTTGETLNIEIGAQKHISSVASAWQRALVGFDPDIMSLHPDQPLQAEDDDIIRFRAHRPDDTATGMASGSDRAGRLSLRQLDFPSGTGRSRGRTR